MGISGLLPALKSIQTTKKLSEFKGKVVAVDAYVWLHRGVFACATDLAIGKSTHKYVDYAMHRVRLLRYHGIQPYIVFDGGPLPAKKGTEADRKSRRDESMAKGQALMAKGNFGDARDCFVKCIDVTPQMAAQLMKALRAESYPFVVAPYEADAQLAYLERTGIVDAVLTEDSDLLVFGCRTVLFKLDAPSASVVSISRDDFGSVAASSGDPNGISLIGWSDVQFRTMAILSGCDYLPSIPGIGLKTACNLLKKWRTAEGVIRAIAIEGKKSIPTGYLKQYKLAESCFLHQRVYCPRQEKLVHLTNVGADWTDEFDVYVGANIDPILAKSIAQGYHDPATHLPMVDINPGFVPRALKPLRVDSNSPSRNVASKGKGKGRQSLPTPSKPAGGILNFFGPNPIIPPRTKEKGPAALPVRNIVVGKASGKRTLSEAMDQDLDQKKRHRKSNSPPKPAKSRFFIAREPEMRSGGIQRRHSDGVIPIAGPSHLAADREGKENIYITVDDEFVETSDPELDGSDLSHLAQVDDLMDSRTGFMDEDEIPNAVEQEDGYISPSPSCSKDAQDLSSPPGSRQHPRQTGQTERTSTGLIASDEEDADFGADAVSSPISVKKPKSRRGRLFQPQQTPTRWLGNTTNACGSGQVLVEPTPSPTNKRIYPDVDDVPSPTLYRGPDLRSMLGTDADDSTELEFGATPRLEQCVGSASPPSPSPETPDGVHCQQLGGKQVAVVEVDNNFESDLDWEDEEARREQEADLKNKAMMEGWRKQWALTSKTPVHYKGGILPHKTDNKEKQKHADSPSSRHVSTPLARIRPSSPKKATSSSASGSRPLRPSSPKKAFAFTPGSRPAHSFNLKRSNTNVTPATREYSSVGGGGYKPPRSAPSEINGHKAAMNPPSGTRHGGKPQRNLLFFEAVGSTSSNLRTSRETVDLTMGDDDLEDDDIEDMNTNTGSLIVSEEKILSSTQMRLSQFRCS